MNTGDRIVGVGAIFGYRLSRRFALEATLNGFSGDPRNNLGRAIPPPVLGSWRSGNILQGQFGLSANLLQTSKADFFLTAKPGFISFSHLMYSFDPGMAGIGIGAATIDRGRQTSFAPFFGGGTQIYPTKHSFIRFDAGGTIIRYSQFRTTMNIAGITDPALLPVVGFPGATTYSFQFSTGIGFRFGGRR